MMTEEQKQEEPSSYTIPILGIDCAACAPRIEQIARGCSGVQSASLNGVSGCLTMEADPTALPVVCRAVSRAGFSIPMETYTCEGVPEQESIRQKLEILPEVKSADFQNGQLNVVCYPTDTAKKAVETLLRSSGIFAELSMSGGIQDAIPMQQADLLRRIILAFFFSLPVFWNMSPMVQLVCTAVVLFVAGSLFFRGARRSFTSRTPNMDLLIVLSTTLVFVYSTVIVFTGKEPLQLYYLCCCVLVLLLLFGRYLSVIAKGQAARGVEELVRLMPTRAHRLHIADDGTEEEETIPAEEIRQGDWILVRAGEGVPADGRIVETKGCCLDESMMTGESLPVEKKIGDEVTGGTILRAGSLVFAVTGSGDATRLSQMEQIVLRAQNSRAPVQDLADRIAGIFIPCVLLVTLIVFLAVFRFDPDNLGTAVLRACGVLVVACPCALGLATPASIMVGVSKGSESGILFRDGTALETGTKVDTICIDKTGTLTTGELSVTDWNAAPGCKEDASSLLSIAAGLERESAHPAAAAIRALAKEKAVCAAELADVQERIGRGVSGALKDRTFLLGGAALLAELGIPVPAESGEAMTLYLVSEGSILALFHLSDTLRPDAKEAVASLQKRGLRVIMLTGDRMAHAAPVAKALGIEEVQASLLPDQKASFIESLRKEGHVVLMAGDGFNDAPPLSCADLSCAMAAKNMSAAVETSRCILMSGKLSDLDSALTLSFAVMKNIRGNLLFSLCYNAVAIPLAAIGLINPSIAAAAMSLSSISVILHSLSLKKVSLS